MQKMFRTRLGEWGNIVAQKSFAPNLPSLPNECHAPLIYRIMIVACLLIGADMNNRMNLRCVVVVIGNVSSTLFFNKLYKYYVNQLVDYN
ncbi:MAG: hypothetical protein B6247_23915 [Candidatus Parabeggiatoa sp. nov. 2]|nr:MAG: hypothetical protein B6247_23915 [Beggiatoa sp. 4572_84]